jgi:hypothetical protein
LQVIIEPRESYGYIVSILNIALDGIPGYSGLYVFMQVYLEGETVLTVWTPGVAGERETFPDAIIEVDSIE